VSAQYLPVERAFVLHLFRPKPVSVNLNFPRQAFEIQNPMLAFWNQKGCSRRVFCFRPRDSRLVYGLHLHGMRACVSPCRCIRECGLILRSPGFFHPSLELIEGCLEAGPFPDSQILHMRNFPEV
jgi:hypothetical protein